MSTYSTVFRDFFSPKAVRLKAVPHICAKPSCVHPSVFYSKDTEVWIACSPQGTPAGPTYCTERFKLRILHVLHYVASREGDVCRKQIAGLHVKNEQTKPLYAHSSVVLKLAPPNVYELQFPMTCTVVHKHLRHKFENRCYSFSLHESCTDNTSHIFPFGCFKPAISEDKPDFMYFESMNIYSHLLSRVANMPLTI